MRYFKVKEFACRCGCEMPLDVKENVKALVEMMLDPARERLGKAIVVNSGYRCAIRNMVVGGAAHSQHTRGEAADVRADTRNANLELARIIAERDVFDQLILEECDVEGRPMWLHVSWKRNGMNRHEVLRKPEGCDDMVRLNRWDLLNQQSMTAI